MLYLISFLEGIITFISPCLLPMIPVYISYFAGGGKRDIKRTLIGAFGFVAGFTIVFVAMGAMAGTAGSLLIRYQTPVNIITGLVVVFFGLNYTGIMKVNLFGGIRKTIRTFDMGFFSAALFGVIFSVGWTPCVGAFLGTALMMASQQGKAITGIMMLLCYSLGLGIPFIISALLIDRLKAAFDLIKRNYKTINIISGGFLIIVGILMMTGTMGRLLVIMN